MSGTGSEPWRERAETVDSPASVTILGVDRGDVRLPVELPTFVPEEADVIVTDHHDDVTARERVRGYARNPAVAFAWLEYLPRVAHDLAVYGRADRCCDRAAVEDLANERDVDVFDAGRHPVLETTEPSQPWLAGGWFVTLATLVGVVAVAVQPHLGTGLFLLACVALTTAYLLARSGARMEARQERIFERLQEIVSENEYRHPTVVVRAGHVPGIADRAKEARIRTRDRQVSPASNVDP